MMDIVKRLGLAVVLGGLMFASSATAMAQKIKPSDPPPGQTKKAPEIDPTTAGAVVSVLVGGMAVIGARRVRRVKQQSAE